MMFARGLMWIMAALFAYVSMWLMANPMSADFGGTFLRSLLTVSTLSLMLLFVYGSLQVREEGEDETDEEKREKRRR